MARIRQEDVDAVRDRTDLVRLVQQYVALKKAGRSFSGLCPFHPEKTPSFTVDPAKGLFYCFGCGKGGNAFHFLQEIEGLTFPEAAERLAHASGITLRYEGGAPKDARAASRKQALYRANSRAAELYHRFLMDDRNAEQARRYLQKRGLSKESVEEFGIGYAPGYPDFLLKRMAKDFSPEILVEAGVAMRDGRGQVRDRFRSRVLFPIHDLTGQAVGFGARLLEGDGPKYLNSPETPVYRKGELLYNLHRAKGELTRSGRAFVVEGYTDVIALHQAGIPTAVATCGTAISEGHFRLLSRFCPRIVLAFDSDEAGARAAERAYGMFEAFGVEVLVLILPEGQDPADLVTAEGPEAFEKLAARAEPVVEYMLRRRVRGAALDSPEGKSRAWREALPIVAGLKDQVLRSEYAGRLADLVGVSDTDVRLELERDTRGDGDPQPQRKAATQTTAEGPPAGKEVEKEALKVLAQRPELAGDQLGILDEEHFTTERFRKAWNLLRESPGDPGGLAGRADERSLAELLAEITVEPLKGEANAEYAERIFAKLEERRLKEKMRTMKKRLESLNPVNDAPTFDALFAELAEVTGRWRTAKARAGEGA
ncbi:MAG TPA: DNA primase [Actinomycetota bacterium]|nr:DNA primase [Actinomycetota bacterium]